MGASLRQELTPLKAAAELEDIVLVLEVATPAEAPSDEGHVRLVGKQASNCQRLTTTPFFAVLAVTEHSAPASVYTPSAADIRASAPEQEDAHR